MDVFFSFLISSHGKFVQSLSNRTRHTLTPVINQLKLDIALREMLPFCHKWIDFGFFICNVSLS